jgi:hypothetical protein
MENITYELDTRLFNVTFGKNKNIHYTGIEAASLDEAKAKAESEFKDKAVEITSDPIFEGSLGIESDGIFEISIKGVDQSKVNKFTELLAKFIGGIAVACTVDDHDEPIFDDYDKPKLEIAAELNRFIDENEMNIVSI